MRCFACSVDFDGDSETCALCGRPLETDSDRYFKEGMEALANGNLDESIALFGGCLSLNPCHLTARFNLGIAYSLNDQCDMAMEELLIVAAQDPNYPGLFTALGQAAFGSYLHHKELAQEREHQMLRLFEEAILRDETDVDALFSLANAYIALDEPLQALSYLNRAASVDPNSPAIYFMLAEVLRMLSRNDEALMMARKSLMVSSPHDDFRNLFEDLFRKLQEELHAESEI
ncbi:MAG: tetratricopeptide repeat protein [Armatimonadota bacterium]|nr:tetratricopeptide repeat protein [Armatimonadota bacterium]